MANTRIPSLDGLRALAISLVLVDHTVMSTGFNSWWLATYAHVGVLIFFVVSGYLITTLMLREEERTGSVNVPQFYIRRVWRIFPVAYAYLAVITLLHHAQFSWRDIGLSWIFMASFGQSFSTTFPWDFGHLWSLSVEEQFYFVWPLVIAAGLYSARYAAWAAVIIAPIFRFAMVKQGLDQATLFAFPAVMDSIATGCLVALYAKPLVRLIGNRRWVGLVWLMALSTPAWIACANSTKLLWPLPQFFGHAAWSVFNVSVGAGILWAIAAQPKILNYRFSIWIGTLSYSLYVWHMPFMNPDVAIPFPLNLVLGFGAAIISYYLIEQPILQLRADLKTLPIHETRALSY